MAFILQLFMTALAAAVTRATGHNDIRPLTGQRVTTGIMQGAGTGQGEEVLRRSRQRAAVSSLADSTSCLSEHLSVALGTQGQHRGCGEGCLPGSSLKLN